MTIWTKLAFDSFPYPVQLANNSLVWRTGLLIIGPIVVGAKAIAEYSGLKNVGGKCATFLNI